MRVRVIEGRAEVVAELERAEPLAEELGAPLTARSAWLAAAVQHLPGRAVAVSVRSDDDRIDGLAVLMIRRRGIVATAMLAGGGMSDHARLLARDDAAADALARAVADVVRGIRGPWRLGFEQLPEGDPVARRLTELLPVATLGEGDVNPLTCFSDDRALARYLSRNGRTTASQGRNRLAREDPDWRIQRTREPAAVEQLLPDVMDLRRRRDHALGRRSELDDHRRAGFFLAAAMALVGLGNLELATLWVNDSVAAYLLVIRDGPVWRFWDNRIDPARAHLRLGRVLDSAMLAAALEDPDVGAVDWMRGQMRHKEQATNAVLPTCELRAWSSRVVRTSDRLAGEGRARVRRLVPERMVRRIRGGGEPPAPVAATAGGQP